MMIYSKQTATLVDTSILTVKVNKDDVVAYGGTYHDAFGNPGRERFILAECGSRDAAEELMLEIALAAKKGESAFIIE